MCQCFVDGKTLKRRLSNCGVNFNVNTQTAACDLSRHQDGGGSRFEVQFIPTSEPHKLESRLQKSWRLPQRLVKAHIGRSLRHNLSTSKINDHPKIWPTHKTHSVINSNPWLLIDCSHLTAWPWEKKHCYENTSWHPPLWPAAAAMWLLLSSAQDGRMLCFKLANTSEPCAKLPSPKQCHTAGV